MHRLRWRSGLLIASLACAVVLTVNAAAPDETFRIIGLYYTAGFFGVVAALWWFLWSGVRPVVRLALPAVAAAAGAGTWFGLIRRVDFNGAMLPRPVWRWQPTANQARRDWDSRHSSVVIRDPDPKSTFRVTAEDWPRYCGPDGRRVISEPLLYRDWRSRPPKQLWRRPVGEAWSSFAVAGSRLFTQEQRGRQECVVCYHADSGQELWVHESPARYETAMGGIGPRATPTVTDRAVFTLGATGLLTCLDPVSGLQKWQQDITETAQAHQPEWGFSGSPLLFQDLVIVITGGPFGTVAFSQKDGSVVWKSVAHRTGYSSPRLETISGRTMLLAFHGDGLTALNPRDGQQFWHFPFTNMYHINAAQPILVDGLIFIGTGYDGRCTAVDPARVREGVPQTAWSPNRNLNLKFNEAVEYNGFIFGLDDGILSCIDSTTGQRRWKGGRYRHGQVLRWDDVLLVQAEKGFVALVEATPEQYREITRFAGLSERSDGIAVKAWNVPAVSRSRLYLRTDREAACFLVPSALDDRRPKPDGSGS